MKKSNIIIVSIILLLAIGCGGYFLLFNKDSEKKEKENITDPVVKAIDYINNNEKKLINFSKINNPDDIKNQSIETTTEIVSILNDIKTNKKYDIEKIDSSVGFEMKSSLEIIYEKYSISFIDDYRGFIVLFNDLGNEKIETYLVKIENYNLINEIENKIIGITEKTDMNAITNSWINYIKEHNVKEISYSKVTDPNNINNIKLDNSNSEKLVTIFNDVLNKTTEIVKIPTGVGFEMKSTLTIAFDNYEISIIDDSNGFAILLQDITKNETTGYMYELKDLDIFAEFDKLK